MTMPETIETEPLPESPAEALADALARAEAADTRADWESARADAERHLPAEHERTPVDIAADAIGGEKPAAAAAREARELIEAARPLDVSRERHPGPPPQAWLVPDWLPADRLAMLTGEGGAGKSRLVLQLAAAAAAGHPAWLPAETGRERGLMPAARLSGGPLPVVWATWEDGHDEIDRRLRKAATRSTHSGAQAIADWAEGEASWPVALADRLAVVDMAGAGPIWGPGEGLHVSTAAGLRPAGARLLALAAEADAALLVIDPLAAAYAGSENDRGLVRAFCSALDSWARTHECAVLLIAHPSKGEAGQQYSGSTDWRNAVRVLWTLTREKRGEKPKGNDDRPAEWRLALDKSNYGPPQDARLVRRHPPNEPGRTLPDAPRGFWQDCGKWDESGPGTGAVDVGSVSSHADNDAATVDPKGLL